VEDGRQIPQHLDISLQDILLMTFGNFVDEKLLTFFLQNIGT